MPDTAVLPTVDEAVALGLTRAEYALIVDKLGRAPNQVELAMFSLLWSEHCAYKHSKLLLKTLPTEGRHVVMGPGENPNGSARDIAGVCNAAGNVVGLMPHPEHAVDELCGASADGLKLFQSAVVVHA